MAAMNLWRVEIRKRVDMAVKSRALIDEGVTRLRSNGPATVRVRLDKEIAAWTQILGEAQSPDRPLA